ncbi:ubiquitin carboxyl-terminal hydrolase 38-like isoform X2 [Physella acuta]|nr:ubiquitin carboxyl-terminal hydrolase 38-like isoform X2 [Physella acuta]XP_059155628.1 ubiquitin carboxyl-terminal hydrolase 38-like isoform X2 [Physella acuta]
MDQILEGLLESQQPDGVKVAIISRICDQGTQQNHPVSAIKGVFQVSCKWVLHGTTALQVSSGFKLLNTWGVHNLESFLSFFTPEFVSQVLNPGYGTDANVPLLIREGLRVLSHMDPSCYVDHTLVVQRNITRFITGTSDCLLVRNVGLLLSEFTDCIPTVETNISNFCLAVIHLLSVAMQPTDGKEILKVMKLMDEIGNFLSLVWKLNPPSLLSDCLVEIFRIISSPRTELSAEPAISLATVVKHIPIEFANRVVKDVVTDTTISDESIGTAVGQIVEWLKWPMAQNVDLWLSCFLTELALNHRYTLLVQITETNTEQVVDNLAYPQLWNASFKILSQMLLSYQRSPSPFHKALEKVPCIIAVLRKEGTKQSQANLVKLSQLLHCLMYLHTGFPELYDPILDLIKDLPTPSTDEIKTKLQQTKWSSVVSDPVPIETSCTATLSTAVKHQKLETGKTGLENLGNTCYMNSVLQALYMCDQFRRGILNKAPSGRETLLVKLQHVFAMLSQSSRPAIAPTKFLQASRPPWFQPGHQQDCSEFLKYLLDQLHEDEKTASAKTLMKSPSTGSMSNENFKMTDGSVGKGSKKATVMLTAIKKMTEEEMNGGGSSESDKLSQQPPTLVENTFRGKVQTTLRCLACKQESQRVESFSDIPLAFPNASKSSDYPHKILAGGSGVPTSNSVPESPQSEKSLDFSSMSEGSKGTFTLNDLISFYLKPEMLTGDNKYHCDSCGKLQDGERRIHILESPQYLILTLLRFSYDTKLQTRTKIFQDVRYPRTLAVPVCKPASSPTDSKSNPLKHHTRAGSLSGMHSRSNSLKNPVHLAKLEGIAQKLAPSCEGVNPGYQFCDLYGLSAVIVHSGVSSECGHYYCYARHSQAGQIDLSLLDRAGEDYENLDLLPDKWYNFNDSRVSHAHFETFSNVTKRFSKDTVYVLIYRKIDTGGQSLAIVSDPILRPDLRDAVVKDNEAYQLEQEQEAKAMAEQRRRSSSASSTFRNWRDDDDDDDRGGRGGPPGCGDGFCGGLDTSGSRFVF